MKFLISQLSYLLGQQKARRNLKALLKYLVFLTVIVFVYAFVFHCIMVLVEKQEHSFTTGIYWTLTVMSTLGFGDITFNSDLGRAFSILVLMSGIVLLLIVLPFTFIRYFYAPWLEAQLRIKAPRQVPENKRNHVIICRHDTVAQSFIKKLRLLDIPYYVIEPDPAEAANLHEDGVSVVTGEIDSSSTFKALRACQARMVLSNLDDATNTNITLTVRENAPDVPLVAIVENLDSMDILDLAGASRVLPLKQILGEHLANRVNAEHANVHVIGTFKDLLIAEFPVHKTPLAGRTIRESRLRQITGVSVVGIWVRGRIQPVTPDTVLEDYSVPVIVGTARQIEEIETFLVIYNSNPNPVLVLGGGNVGCATARALKEKGVPVHVIERDRAAAHHISGIADRIFIGDAADRKVLMDAGLAEAPSIVITTNNDAINIYLSVYCRRLSPQMRIVSRITHERNLEAIHRAGADFVLSYTSLGAELIFSILQNRELVMLGEGIDVFMVKIPRPLVGKTIGTSEIGARTGLSAIAVQKERDIIPNPPADFVLEEGSELLLIGTTEQRMLFNQKFR
jgi:voltage-gated potassium channel